MTPTRSPAALAEAEAVRTETAFADLAAPWRAFWSALDETPFLSPEWHLAWWRTLPEGAPEVVLVRRDGELVALAPCVRVGDRLRFAGGDLTDVLDVLAVDDAAARALARAMAERAARIELRYIPSGARSLGAFADELAHLGLAVSSDPLVVSPRVRLRASFEEQLASLARKDRHELRRKLRRFESAGSLTFGFVAADEVPASLERFVSWHRAAPGEKALFLTTAREAFFREIASRGAAAGWFRLGELRLDERPVASLFAIESGSTLAAYNSAVDPEAAPLSPGIVLHACAMRDAIARGLRVYDLLRGDEPYKYDLGGEDLQLYRLAARRDGR